MRILLLIILFYRGGFIFMLDMGEKIKDLRLKKKLTQKQLAAKIGINESGISQYEKNLRLPSLEVLTKLCLTFGVSADYFLNISDTDKLKELTNNLTISQIDIITSLAYEFQKANLKAID